MTRAAILILAIHIVGCASSPAQSRSAIPSPTDESRTSNEEPTMNERTTPSSLEEAVRNRPVIILGEMHGNDIGARSLVEATELADGPVAIGLEAPERDTSAFRAYLDSEGTDADREALLETSFWAPKAFDGRANEALFDMFETLRLRRAAGLDIDVFGFLRAGSYDPDDQDPHEQRLANAIVEYHRATPDRVVVALVGNFHARLTPFDFGRGTTTPMANRIIDEIPEMLSVKLAYEGGETLAVTRDGLGLLKLNQANDTVESWSRDPDGDFHILWPVGIATPSGSPHPDFVAPE